MAEKLRIGLVSGIRHQDDYAPFFARHPDVALVGLADDADISEEYHALNRDLADQFGLEYSTDLDAFLARDDVDAVCVAPEYARHTPLALRAIAANKHVLVDKPIGITLEQCDALIEAGRKSKRTFAWIARIGHPSLQRAHDAVAAGELGTIVNVNAHFLATYGNGEKWDDEEYAFFDPVVNGGGELLNFGLYPLTAILNVTGLAPSAVHCVKGAYYNRPHREFDIEDMALLDCEMENGILASICVGRAHVPGNLHNSDLWLEVTGTQGTLVTDELVPDAMLTGPTPGHVERRYRSPYAGSGHFEAVIDNFVWAVQTGGQPFLGADEAEKVMHTVFAAYESATTGQVVNVG
ncbi:MAG: Gfo/Idh/MocA family oxidoreductase [Chloroflexota bacterium]|nr:Gfo/Idh/MocA family oxidoreductase [Chloroflexota bacterium]MDE2841621.1 Gfo/Idh/MocA family oxidoreductase [Chloroflexota bacterium]MDE2931187.1 Gfo/Idh/MocA family oxidoreductase [Chloroflexota bacterium]